MRCKNATLHTCTSMRKEFIISLLAKRISLLSFFVTLSLLHTQSPQSHIRTNTAEYLSLRRIHHDSKDDSMEAANVCVCIMFLSLCCCCSERKSCAIHLRKGSYLQKSALFFILILILHCCCYWRRWPLSAETSISDLAPTLEASVVAILQFF